MMIQEYHVGRIYDKQSFLENMNFFRNIFGDTIDSEQHLDESSFLINEFLIASEFFC
jgi:hypothetical protein